MQQFVTFEDIPAILRKAGASHVLLVTGRQSFNISGASERLERALRGIEYTRFCDFQENPVLDDLRRGLAAVAKKSFDFVISIGGGSAIDVAKSINALEGQNTERFEDFVTGERSITSVHAPMLAIPTTFGTGSESTHFAVVYIRDKKYSVASTHILPHFVVLEPDLGLSAPRHIIASVGLDALCQAIESFWAGAATNESRNYAKAAISKIYPAILDAANTRNIQAMGSMAQGANLAGRAINISKTTAPHALSYGLTKKFGIPHGFAVATTLPYFLRHNYVHAQDDILRSRMEKLFELLDAAGPDQAWSEFRQLVRDLGIDELLSEFCPLPESDIQYLARSVNSERLQNHPVALNHDDLVAALGDSCLVSWEV